MGNNRKRGDSWFSGDRPGRSITQEVTANPGTLYFVCAIHPWMQGRIDVVAPTAIPPDSSPPSFPPGTY